MLGNGPHVLGNGPQYVMLGNGPQVIQVMGHMCRLWALFVHSIHEYMLILIMGRLGWVVDISWPLLVLSNGPHVLGNGHHLSTQFLLFLLREG